VRSGVSVLFSEPKIPQSSLRNVVRLRRGIVSVLFSEPKIPQLCRRCGGLSTGWGFSALQRAENSSIERVEDARRGLHEFQCSSASRKFLNRSASRSGCANRKFQCSSASRKFLNYKALRLQSLALGFSALQRAENSSIGTCERRHQRQRRNVSVLFSEPKIPQLIT